LSVCLEALSQFAFHAAANCVLTYAGMIPHAVKWITLHYLHGSSLQT